MERLTKRPLEGEEAFLSCEKCGKEAINQCWDQLDCTQTAVDRLAAIEDILGDDYDLDRLRELLEACKGLEPSEIAESKLLIATRKDPEKLARMAELVEADRDGRYVVLPCHIGDPVFMGTGRSKITGYEEDVCDGFYIGRNGVLQVKAQNHKGNHGTYGVIGQTAELTREAAEAALKRLTD